MNVKRSGLIAGSLSLLAVSSSRIAQAQATLANLRVGAVATDTYAQAYYAQDLGFFQKSGLNVELQTFNGGAALSAAVVGGSLDIGISSPVQLANALLRGVPFTLIAAGAIQTPNVPGGLVCVDKDGPLRSAKDLEGKTVALPALKTISEAALDVWLTKNGADVAKVRTIEIAFSEMGAAIERGTVAAAFIAEPALSLALKTGRLRSLGDPFAAIARQMLFSAWFATTTFVEKNPDIVRRFRIAIAEAGRWANDHHNESAAILAKYSKQEPDAIRATGRSMFTDQLRPSDIQPQLDAAVKFGVMAKPVIAADMIAH